MDFHGVVAIDGPSGSGKSTVSRLLAQRLHARYLDTGAMYRALTWAVLRAGVDPDDPAGVTKVLTDTRLEVGTDPTGPTIAVNGTDVAEPIRTPEVSSMVSHVAAVPAVRAALVAQQREIIAQASAGIVVEGRDIGTEVAPDASLKVYLTASPDERARRRSAERGRDLKVVAEAQARRDRLDSGRAVSPLRRADDATEVDTTGLDVDQVVETLLGLLTRGVPA